MMHGSVGLVKAVPELVSMGDEIPADGAEVAELIAEGKDHLFPGSGAKAVDGAQFALLPAAPGIDLLLLTGSEGTGNAPVSDHFPAFIGKHPQRTQIDAGRSLCQHTHGIICLACIGSAYMDYKVPSDLHFDYQYVESSP